MSMYIQSPILDQRYSQVRIGPSPYSSAKAHRVTWEPRTEFGYPSVERRDTSEQHSSDYFSCRVTYPSVIPAQGPPTPLQPQRDPADPTTESTTYLGRPPLPITREEMYRTLQQPNVYWSHPPPTRTPTVDRRSELDRVPDVALHPHLSRLQASENAKAAQFNASVAVIASPSCRYAPREQRLERKNLEGGGGGGPDGAGAGDTSTDFIPSNVLSGDNVSKGPPKKDSQAKDAISREYSAEGGYFEPEHYRSSIISFASTQPSSLSAIAAKAIASAIHGVARSHAIPCNALVSSNHRPLSHSGPVGSNANKYRSAGLHDTSNAVVPPSASFRTLSSGLQAVLMAPRTAKTRGAVEQYLLRTRPVLQPPPSSVAVATTGVAPSATLLTKEPEEEPHTTAAEEGCGALGLATSLGVWNHILRVKGIRTTDDDGDYSGPMAWVTGGRVIQQAMQGCTPCFQSSSLKPMFATYLGSVGLRRGESITMPMPPTHSNFQTKPGHIKETQEAMMKYACNSFALDDVRLLEVIGEGGGEVEQVWLEGMPWLSEKCFVSLGELCPNLKMLNAAGCTQLGEEAMLAIAKGCRLLAYLNASGCPNLTAKAIGELLGNARDLSALCLHNVPFADYPIGGSVFQCLSTSRALMSLDVSFCAGVTDAALLCIAKYCQSLEMLDVSGCANIGDVGIASVGGSCGRLSVFKLKLCDQKGLTGHGLSTLTRASHNMKHIDLSGCTQLENATLATILIHAPTLLELSISGCTKLTDEAVSGVAKTCKSLRMLDLSSCQSVSLGSCMDLVNDLPDLTTLIVSESSIASAEVVMLSSMRDGCAIIRNQYRAVPQNPIVCMKIPDKVVKVVEAKPKGKK